MKFKRDDRVKIKTSFFEKLYAVSSWYLYTGNWIWGPTKKAYILEYREDMAAYQVVDWYGRYWYVDEDRLEFRK